MAFKKIAFTEGFEDLHSALRGSGAFLVVRDRKGKPSPMTIGWALMGTVWSRPVLAVFVRRSRHTFGLMEKAKTFSVNAPLGRLAPELEFCGTRSGRDCDKLRETGLRSSPGKLRGTTILPDCDLFFECETLHSVPLEKKGLDKGIIKWYYHEGDLHTVYFGRIAHAYRRFSGRRRRGARGGS